MLAICYSGPMSPVTTNELLSEKRTGEEFQIDTSKTEKLVCIQTDGHGFFDLARQPYHLYIHFIGSLTFLFGCYKHHGKLNTCILCLFALKVYL